MIASQRAFVDALVPAIAGRRAPQVTIQELPAQVELLDYMAKNDYQYPEVSAIKRYREATGVDLALAQRVVEVLQAGTR